MSRRASRDQRDQIVLEWIAASGGFASIFMRSLREVARLLLKPRHYIELIAEQFVLLGIQSIPLVIVSGVATGAVMAMQFGYGLQRYGGLNTVPRLVGLAVFRELGPVLTSLLLGCRTGSGIAAEIASMTVTQQIDALRALDTSPYSTLVFPRVVACFFAFPILGLFSDYVSVVAGMVVCEEEFGMNPSFYLSKTIAGVSSTDLTTGVSKMFIFGLMVALAACWKGLNVRGGTRSVGNATTWVVVTTSVMIMLSDVVLNKFFITLGLFQ